LFGLIEPLSWERMSKLIGDSLPADVLAALDGRDLERKIGPAYLLLTADEDGLPRPCMLSAGEVLAVDARHVRLALWRGTSTAANLSRDGRAVFCYVVPGTVLYVRGTVRRLAQRDGASLECFELGVQSVESDAHAGMPVTSGIAFAVERGDPADVAEAWQRQLALLRD
jgi:hypothetical protein